MFMAFLVSYIERTGKFMIKNKGRFKEGGGLIARQGAMKSGCIRSLPTCNGLFKDT